MIVLDTNVISEPLRPAPNSLVISWLDEQHLETLYLTSITLAEMRYGIACLPAGRRREQLHERFEGETVPLFADRILDFDEPASRAYADLQSAARANGHPLRPMDGLIASICLDRGFILATRNVSDFEHTDVPLLDPWEA